MARATCPDDCSTVGVDARSLERYADVDTDDGARIVFDEDSEDAWIQSDVYYPRTNCA